MSRRRPVILRKAAEAEIDQIAQFLAQNSLNAALRFYDALDETTRMLAWMPRLGKRRIACDAALAELRSWSVTSSICRAKAGSKCYTSFTARAICLANSD